MNHARTFAGHPGIVEGSYMKRPKLGQHFLVEKNTARKIVDSANLTKNDTVIEIGPGKGILTEFILSRVRKLLCVEIDRNLVFYLKERFKGNRKVRIIHADFLVWEPPGSLLKLPTGTTRRSTRYSPIKFISNLPYYITTPILKKIFDYKNWSSAVFTVQKEVGERILASPNTKNYGQLTLFVEYFSNVRKITKISRKCFYPEPKVDSIVLKLTRKTRLPPKKFYKAFSKIVSSAFKYRRKTVINALSKDLKLNKKIIHKTLLASNIQPSTRAENITFGKYLELTNSFKNSPSRNKQQGADL